MMQFTNSCPRCKAEHPKDSRFCPVCGYAYNKLLAKAAPASPPTPPVVTRTVRPEHAVHPEAQRTVQPQGLLPQSRGKGAGRSSLSGLIRPIEIVTSSQPRISKKEAIVEQRTQQLLASQSQDQKPQVATQPTVPVRASTPLPQPVLQHSPLTNTPLPLSSQSRKVITDHPNALTWQQRPAAYSPSLAATSQAAEHWRTSWRNRQHSEAGPATEVSRGQSAVPEPLLAMQDSLIRMRAIILPDKADEHHSRVRFWCSLLLILGLMSLSWAYIISTFLATPSSTPGTIHPAAITLSPHLTVISPQTATIAQGRMLHLHGEHFGTGDPILFVLDDSHTLNDTNGKKLTITANDQGTFDVVLSITPAWTPGLHILQADDTRTSQIAYLNIQISS